MPCPTKLSFCQRRELLLCALFFVEHMRERVVLKSPVREYRPPGSVRGAPGNRCPYLDTFNGGGSGSIKQRVHHSRRDAPVVAAVHAVTGFLDAVESFEADTQAFAQLPDHIRAGILGRVIKRWRLPGGIVEVHIAV